MEIKLKGKWQLTENGCDDTSVAAIGNGFLEVLRTYIKVTLVGFDIFICKKSITIGALESEIDLPSGTEIAQMN